MGNRFSMRDEKFELIEKWQQSGLSQKAFIEEHQLKSFSFYYWLRQYRKHKSLTTENQGRFIGLDIKAPLHGASVEVQFPDGVRLIFNTPVSADYLKAVIS